MGNTDSIPVISQLRSAVQALAGDIDGARTTQKNFVRGCPIISQVTSAVQAIRGDNKAAVETQIYCVKGLSKLANGIPVVGHIKGGIHYACCDTSGGNDAMIAASRIIGVIACGIGGGLLGGPVGAMVGGVVGGAAMDGITTGVDSAIKQEFSPHGHVALCRIAANRQLDVGMAFDWVVIPVFDSLAGRANFSVFELIRSRITTDTHLKLAVQQTVEAGEMTFQEGNVTEMFKSVKIQ